MKTFHALALGAAVLVTVGPALGAQSGSTEFRANVPAQCSAQIVGDPELGQGSITFSVSRDCNGTHRLLVAYGGETPPGGVTMTFNGNPPTATGAGSAEFTNLPLTNSTASLVIFYAGDLGDLAPTSVSVAMP